MKESIAMTLARIRTRVGGQMIFDVFAWLASVLIAAASRYDFSLSIIDYTPLLVLTFFAGILQVVFGNLFHLYRGRFKIATFDELKALLMTTSCVALPLAIAVLVAGPV